MTWSLVSGVAVDSCSSSVRDVLLVKGGRYMLFILVVARSEVLSKDVARSEVLSKGTNIASSVPVHGSQLQLCVAGMIDRLLSSMLLILCQ